MHRAVSLVLLTISSHCQTTVRTVQAVPAARSPEASEGGGVAPGQLTPPPGGSPAPPPPPRTRAAAARNRWASRACLLSISSVITKVHRKMK